jgi:hypothetical protein
MASSCILHYGLTVSHMYLSSRASIRSFRISYNYHRAYLGRGCQMLEDALELDTITHLELRAVRESSMISPGRGMVLPSISVISAMRT